MTLRSGLAWLGFVGACSVAFAGCGDDDPTGGTAGTGGTGTGGTSKGGTSGTSGASGASGAADGGTSGTAGNAGRGGSAGNPTGGTSGDAGGGGAGGVGAEGGAGGAGEGGAGAGGAGSSGEGGMGGVPDTTADSCTYQCVDDDGCRVGTNTNFKCHPTRKRCERPDLACDSHDDCVAAASNWTTSCVDDTGCTPGFEVCIDTGGRGRCAFTSDPIYGCLLAGGGAETTLPKFGSSGTAVVCASEAGRCDARGQCFTGCSDSPTTICSQARGRGTTCNAATGLCECTASTQCIAMGVSVCNMTTHQCECAGNANCVGVTGADECVSGTCGCSSANVCPAGPFMTTTKVCE